MKFRFPIVIIDEDYRSENSSGLGIRALAKAMEDEGMEVLGVTSYGDLSQFGDTGALSGWAQEGVSWAVGAGLISGKGDGVLDPQGATTRAEAAAILQRFLEK